MIIYTARQEVFSLSRSKLIWPKELQLISRQTDRSVRKLASLYKKGVRFEPFSETDLVANEQVCYSHRPEIISKQRSTIISKFESRSLVSPKATKAKDVFSSEKR